MLLSCVACGNHVEEQNGNPISQQEPDTELPQKEVEIGNISMEITDFSVRLLQAELKSAKGNENRLLSPYSVMTALTMLGNGAKSETKEQIEEVLGISIEDLNAYIFAYMEDMSETEGNRFHMANSIWLTEDSRFTVREEFIHVMKEYFDADVYEKPFKQTTVSEINQWVEEHTDGLIKEILNEIPADAVMYLINALVFDAKWEETYEESDMREGTFTTFDGIEQEIDFMFSEEMIYLEDEYATGFMKYYEGRDYAFVALLPNENMPLSEYVDAMSGEYLHALLGKAQDVKTQVWLPGFEVEYQSELQETLETMGMTDVFDVSKADLSELGTSTQGNLYVDQVIHKTYMEVSPVGTKAGAATVIGVDEGCAIEPEDMKEVCLDRPFLYMIIDCDSNTPIFVGTANYILAYRCGVTDDLCGYPTAEDCGLE